jgi:hypothetical protein
LISGNTENNNHKVLHFSYTTDQLYPKFTEKSGKEYIYYGAKNDLPYKLIDLYNSSPTHGRLIKNITNQVAGKKVKIKGDVKDDKLQTFIDKCNSKGESLHDVIKKISKDFLIFGGWCTSNVWTKGKERFDIVHTDFSTIRSGKMEDWVDDNKNKQSDVLIYFFSNNWKKSNPKYEPIPAFGYKSNRTGTELYYVNPYEPDLIAYPLPEYYQTIKAILWEIKILDFINGRYDNGCFPSLSVTYTDGIPTDEIKDQIYENWIGDQTGPGNNSKVIIGFSNGKDNAPVIEPLDSNEDGGKAADEIDKAIQEIVIGWGITSPELVGIQTAARLGNSNIIEAQQLLYSTVIKPKQEAILSEINYLLKENGFENEIEIETIQPIEFSLSEEMIKYSLSKDEIRKTYFQRDALPKEAEKKESELRSTVGGANALIDYQSKYNASLITYEQGLAALKLLFDFDDVQAASLLGEKKVQPDQTNNNPETPVK